MEISFLDVIILGIVEGLTEYIPVSSTGHLILVSHFLGYAGNVASSFNIFIQFGAIMAVVACYPKRFIQIFDVLKAANDESGDRHLNLWHIILCIFPVLLIGFLFYSKIKAYLFSPVTVAIGLILGGLLMVFADRIQKKGKFCDSLDTISYRQAFYVGLAQCFSLWPGVSRSAATILGGLFLGFNYQVAAEFSFIVAVPVISLAILYDLLQSYAFLSAADMGSFLLGCLIAFGVAYFSIRIFLKLLTKYKLVPFGWYRILIGVLVLTIT